MEIFQPLGWRLAAHAYAEQLAHALRTPLFACTAAIETRKLRKELSDDEREFLVGLSARLDAIDRLLTLAPLQEQSAEKLEEISSRVRDRWFSRARAQGVHCSEERSADGLAWTIPNAPALELLLSCAMSSLLDGAKKGDELQLEVAPTQLYGGEASSWTLLFTQDVPGEGDEGGGIRSNSLDMAIAKGLAVELGAQLRLEGEGNKQRVEVVLPHD